MHNTITVGTKKIGKGEEIFTIAEVGINHNGDPKIAKQLIDKAAWAGASAVKLQTYLTEKRVAKDSPFFGILKQCELSFDVQKELITYAESKGILVFSTPFDEESVDFLASVNTPCLKIASFDVVNTKLLRAVAAKKLPVIMSRGMATQKELDIAVDIFKKANVPLALLHCISAYPVPSHKDLHLSTIRAIEERYGCPTGFSDHTTGIEAPTFAIAAGAVLIEKHFTLSKKAEGPDHALSTEPEEMKTMIESMRRVQEMMGTVLDGAEAVEEGAKQFRRPS
jgi:sialic acid synthase SpsE